MSSLPRSHVIACVKCRAREEVSQSIVDSRAVNRSNGEVVLKGKRIESTK
jgi:hypothetical protein